MYLSPFLFPIAPELFGFPDFTYNLMRYFALSDDYKTVDGTCYQHQSEPDPAWVPCSGRPHGTVPCH